MLLTAASSKFLLLQLRTTSPLTLMVQTQGSITLESGQLAGGWITLVEVIIISVVVVLMLLDETSVVDCSVLVPVAVPVGVVVAIGCCSPATLTIQLENAERRV
jgi:hypothetical protein